MLTAPRRVAREIRLGGLSIGGSHPIRVQSMTNTDTRDLKSTLAQIGRLERAGCEIVRVAVIDQEAARCLSRIKEKITLPLVADIHFDYRLALEALKNGAEGVRVNPGNIGGEENLLRVAEAAERTGACLRIGVNAGSLEKDILAAFGRPSPEALVESALRWVRVLEREDFLNFKVSLKSSSVEENVAAAALFAARSEVPLHLGLTEAGPLIPGVVKSALGIGLVLVKGIGETIRVSLTRDPVEEIRTGYEILRALGLRRRGVEIVSCPTCGRTEIDLMGLVEEVEARLAHVESDLRVAVMGCVVNGPGEAKEADLGVAGGRGSGLLFSRGEKIRKVKEEEIVPALVKEVEAWVSSRADK